VYTPATIPLSERKIIGEIIFSTLCREESPNIPKWFKLIFKQLIGNSIFIEIQELCQSNPVLAAQITSEIIRSLDRTIDDLLNMIKSGLEKEEEIEDDDKIQPPGTPLLLPGGAGEIQDPSASGGSSLGDGDSYQTTDSAIGSSDESIKSRIEDILDGISLLPIQHPTEDYKGLSTQTKEESQNLLDELLDTALDEALSKANDWKSLYELLVAILPGLGWDYSPGFLKHNLLTKYLELAKLLERIPELKDLANKLGRYHSLMGEKIWDPTAKGKSEVFSVERSGDIERILPGELVQLGYPSTKYLFYSKLADKSLLTYELRGEGWTQPEKHERGPVVICIDTSGSMQGLPENIAKAVSLAIAKEANSQSRSVHMILFGSRNETRELTFNKSENAINSLLELLNLSFGGGTDFDSALRTAITRLKDEEFKLADILFVTDGFGVVDDLKDEIKSIKDTQGTRIFTLLIESDGTDELQTISDETWTLHLTHGVTPSIASFRSRLREVYRKE